MRIGVGEATISVTLKRQRNALKINKVEEYLHETALGMAQFCLRELLPHSVYLCSSLGTQNRQPFIFLPHVDHAHTM